MNIRGKMTQEEKTKRVREGIESQGYTLINEYINEKTVLKMICPNGHERDCQFASFKKYSCNKCVSFEAVQVLIDKILLEGYTIIERPSKANSVLIAKCKNGHIRKAKINNFINHDCIECQGSVLKYDIEQCREIFNSRGFTLLEEEYIDCKTFMKYKCSCGNINKTSLDIIQNSKIDSCKKCKGDKFKGEKHFNWKGGITPESTALRNTDEYRLWRTTVYHRDYYTCQCCWQVNGKLNVHHIHNFSSFIEERHLTENGITLCYDCHSNFHGDYGYNNNDIFQLQEYFDDVRSELGLSPIRIESIVFPDLMDKTS